MMMNEFKFQLICVGVGGTGGYASGYLAQLSSIRSDLVDNIILVDGDVIEERNIERQPYFIHEVGNKKASQLQMKLSAVYPSLACTSYPHYLDDSKQLLGLLSENTVPVIIGSVDNAHARVVMDECFQKLTDVIYIDSGNTEWYGNVKMGIKINGEVLSEPIGKVFPEMLDTSKSVSKSMEHCSGKVFSGKQQAPTNQIAAVIINSMINGLLKGNINKNVVYFDVLNLTMNQIEL